MQEIDGNVIRLVHIEGGTNKETKETEVFYNKELEEKLNQRRQLDKEIHEMMIKSYQKED